MSQILVTGEAKVRDIQGPVVANSGVITALDGDASQYVRGDGTLADFPTSTGGGSSVSYYLNSSVSQGTIGGVAYRQLGKTPIAGAGTDIAISTTGYIASYITDANDPALLEVPAGNFNCEFYFSVNNNTGNPFTYAEVYKYDGTTFTLLGTSVGVPEYITEGTVINPYYFAVPVASSVLSITDRIAIRIYVNVDGRTVTLHTENNHLCQVVTTFSKGLTTLNNLTRQVQFFGTGTSGTDFGIVSSVATHTFNLPVASATNTGKLSSTDWSTFNGKVPYTGAIQSVDLGIWDLDAANLFSNGLGVYIKKNASGLANAVGYVALSSTTYKLGIAEASSGLTGKSFNFDFAGLTDNATRNYTLPDASGTLALTSDLSSYVPYTGATTNVNLGVYSLTANQLIAGGGSTDNVAILTTFDQGNALKLKGSTGDLFFVPYFSPSIGARITAQNTAASANTPLSFYASNFYFNSNVNFGSTLGNGTYTYTLPSATGTLALTSQLSSYVPYTGATASVNLGAFYLTAQFITGTGGFETGLGTGLYLRSNSTATYLSTGYVSLVSNNGNNFNIAYGSSTKEAVLVGSSLTASRSFTFPDASGTLALTSDLSAYLPLAGGTLTGALSGTSATFSGIVQMATGSQVMSNGLLKLGIASGNAGAALQLLGWSAGTNWQIDTAYIGSGFNITPSTTSGGSTFTTPAFSLAANGAATFSSSVNIATTTNDYARLAVKANSTLNYGGFNVYANGNNNFIALTHDNNVGWITTEFATGGTGFTPLAFAIGGGERMKISTTGNFDYGGFAVQSSNNATYRQAFYGGIAIMWRNAEDAYIDSNHTYSSSSTNVASYGSSNGIGRLEFGGGSFTWSAYNGSVAAGSVYALTEVFNISKAGIIKSLPTYNNSTGLAANMQIDSNGFMARSTVSSLRYKENINDWNGGLDIVLALKPRTFTYKKDYYDKADIDFLGLIAEEVAEVSPYLADYENEDRTGQVENVRYANIVVPLIKAIQEQQAQIMELKSMILAKK